MISIVIPVGPTYKYFEDTFENINSQLNDYELIVGVDGCNDALKYIQKLLKAKCIQYRLYYSDTNIGPSIMRNTLCMFTRSKSAVFMDADDTVREHFFENLIKDFPKEKECCRLALCVDDNNSQYRNTGIYDLDVFRNIGGYNPFLTIGDDNDLFRRYGKAGYLIGKEPKSIVNYRIHDSNISKTTSEILRNMSRLYRKQTILQPEKHNIIIPYVYDDDIEMIDGR